MKSVWRRQPTTRLRRGRLTLVAKEYFEDMATVLVESITSPGCGHCIITVSVDSGPPAALTLLKSDILSSPQDPGACIVDLVRGYLKQAGISNFEQAQAALTGRTFLT